jgi:hypothetical protein
VEGIEGKHNERIDVSVEMPYLVKLTNVMYVAKNFLQVPGKRRFNGRR